MAMGSGRGSGCDGLFPWSRGVDLSGSGSLDG